MFLAPGAPQLRRRCCPAVTRHASRVTAKTRLRIHMHATVSHTPWALAHRTPLPQRTISQPRLPSRASSPQRLPQPLLPALLLRLVVPRRCLHRRLRRGYFCLHVCVATLLPDDISGRVHAQGRHITRVFFLASSSLLSLCIICRRPPRAFVQPPHLPANSPGSVRSGGPRQGRVKRASSHAPARPFEGSVCDGDSTAT